MDQDDIGTEVGLGSGHILLDGTQIPPPQKRGHSTAQIWPMYCGQMAAWIKMPLATEVGLGPGHIVLHGDPAAPKKEHSSP